MRSVILLLFLLTSLRVYSQTNDPGTRLAQNFVKALVTSDYNAVEEMLLDSADIQDSDCAYVQAGKIHTVRAQAMQAFFQLHDKFHYTGLPLSQLQLEKVAVAPREAMTLILHVTIFGLHSIIELPYVDTFNGPKLINRMEFDTYPDDGLKKYFNVENVGTLAPGSVDKLYFRCDGCKLVSKTEMPGTNLYVNDSLIARIAGGVQTNTIVFKKYYTTGALRDSTVYDIVDREQYNQSLSDLLVKPNITQSLNGVKIKHETRLRPDGKLFSASDIQGDTVFSKAYYPNGKVGEDKKLLKTKVIYGKRYDELGRLTTYKNFTGREKATSFDDLATFPGFEAVFRQYYDPQYVRKQAWFHRQPEGWFIEMKEDGKKYQLWSFIAQDYVQLPADPFTMFRPSRPSFGLAPITYSDNRSMFTLFSGYTESRFDAITFIRKRGTNFTPGQIAMLRANDDEEAKAMPRPAPTPMQEAVTQYRARGYDKDARLTPARLKDEFVSHLPSFLLANVLRQTATYLEQNKVPSPKVYKRFVELYSRSMNSHMYELTISMIMYGFTNGYKSDAIALIDKSVVGRGDFCALSEFYDLDDIADRNQDLKKFLLEKRLQTLVDKYLAGQ